MDYFILIQEMLLKGGFKHVLQTSRGGVKEVFEDLGFYTVRSGHKNLKELCLNELFPYENMLVKVKGVTVDKEKKLLNQINESTGRNN